MTAETVTNSLSKDNWLQALRGIAALMVLFFHMTPHWALVPALQWSGSITHWGFAGVDIFFVLSGYVVYQSADRDSFRPLAFLWRRSLRIYLGYWPVLAFFAAVTWVSVRFGASQWPDAEKFWPSFWLVQPSLFSNWLPTAWSLTYELYFYLWVCAVCLLALRWRGWAILAALMLLIAWNIGGMLYSMDMVKAGLQPLRFVLTGLGISFLLGAGWAHLRKRHNWARSQPLRYLLEGVALILVGFGIGVQSPWFDRIEGLRAGSFGLVGFGSLWVALALTDLRVPAPRWLVAMGNCSYSLYLLHPILLGIAGHVRWRLIPAEQSAGNLLFALLLPVAIGVLSWLWFKAIEQPLFVRLSPKPGAMPSISQQPNPSP